MDGEVRGNVRRRQSVSEAVCCW